jgi:hypothetical protein
MRNDSSTSDSIRFWNDGSKESQICHPTRNRSLSHEVVGKKTIPNREIGERNAAHSKVEVLRMLPRIELHRSSSGRNLRLKHISQPALELLSPHALTPRAPSARPATDSTRMKYDSATFCFEERKVSHEDSSLHAILTSSSHRSSECNNSRNSNSSRSTSCSSSVSSSHRSTSSNIIARSARDEGNNAVSPQEDSTVAGAGWRKLKGESTFSHSAPESIDFTDQLPVVYHFDLWKKASKRHSLPDAIVPGKKELNDDANVRSSVSESRERQENDEDDNTASIERRARSHSSISTGRFQLSVESSDENQDQVSFLRIRNDFNYIDTTDS